MCWYDTFSLKISSSSTPFKFLQANKSSYCSCKAYYGADHSTNHSSIAGLFRDWWCPIFVDCPASSHCHQKWEWRPVRNSFCYFKLGGKTDHYNLYVSDVGNTVFTSLLFELGGNRLLQKRCNRLLHISDIRNTKHYFCTTWFRNKKYSDWY